jgi:acyl carrier protein
MKEEIFKKIAAVISANNKEIPEANIKPGSSFEELNIDSLDAITLVSELENYYKIILSNEEVNGIRHISDAVDLVEKHLSQK